MSLEETRKRGQQFDDEFDQAISNKRASLGLNIDDSDEPVDRSLIFKILVPQAKTGLIIGRGGSIINQLNNSCGAKIQLSQNNEFYPGSNDRIIVLTGDKMGIANALHEVVTRIVEAPDKKPTGHSTSTQFDNFGNVIDGSSDKNRSTCTIKVLLPRAAVGFMIGTKGSVIRQMSEISQCKLQMGEEADPFDTKERVLIITGPQSENVVLGAQTAMAQLMEENRVRQYHFPGCSYLPGFGVGGPSAGAGYHKGGFNAPPYGGRAPYGAPMGGAGGPRGMPMQFPGNAAPYGGLANFAAPQYGGAPSNAYNPHPNNAYSSMPGSSAQYASTMYGGMAPPAQYPPAMSPYGMQQPTHMQQHQQHMPQQAPQQQQQHLQQSSYAAQYAQQAAQLAPQLGSYAGASAAPQYTPQYSLPTTQGAVASQYNAQPAAGYYGVPQQQPQYQQQQYRK